MSQEDLKDAQKKQLETVFTFVAFPITHKAVFTTFDVGVGEGANFAQFDLVAFDLDQDVNEDVEYTKVYEIAKQQNDLTTKSRIANDIALIKTHIGQHTVAKKGCSQQEICESRNGGNDRGRKANG